MTGCGLHLTNSFNFFTPHLKQVCLSDGLRFAPGLLVADDLMNDRKLDEIHLQATASYGPMQIHMSEDCWADTVLVGQPVAPQKRVSVEELLNAINESCILGRSLQNGRVSDGAKKAFMGRLEAAGIR